MNAEALTAEDLLRLALEEAADFAVEQLPDSGTAHQAIRILRELGLLDHLADGLVLGLAHLDPDDLAKITEAAATSWRIKATPRPAGE